MRKHLTNLTHELNFSHACFIDLSIFPILPIVGNDVLYVGVSGPIVPCEEVNIKHLGDNMFAVQYSVRDRGRHYIMVKWGETHIPGSPFIVDVI